MTKRLLAMSTISYQDLISSPLSRILKPLTVSSILIMLSVFVAQGSAAISSVHVITDSDWEKILEGEWLVKFYAPWCPACQSLAPVWENLGRRSADVGVKVGEVDVTENADLSGRFFVTSLPTIYHVKDGEFRQYKRSRTENDLMSFVVDRKWAEVEPVPWYQSPDSIPMRIIGVFFQGSIAIRNLHTSVTTEYGIPVWVSYVLIAVATLLIGLILGLVCVCMCDTFATAPTEPHGLPIEDDDEDIERTEGTRDKGGEGEDMSASEPDEEGEEEEEEVSEGGKGERDRGDATAARRRNIPQ